jgi:hypothetical protein
MQIGMSDGPIVAMLAWTTCFVGYWNLRTLSASPRDNQYPHQRKILINMNIVLIITLLLYSMYSALHFIQPDVWAFVPAAILAITVVSLVLRPPATVAEQLTCTRCGYDLRGSLHSTTCPECNQLFDPVKLTGIMQNEQTSSAVTTKSALNLPRRRVIKLAVVIVLLTMWVSWSAYQRAAIRAAVTRLENAVRVQDRVALHALTTEGFRKAEMNQDLVIVFDWCTRPSSAHAPLSVYGNVATLYYHGRQFPLYSGAVIHWHLGTDGWQISRLQWFQD